MNNLRKGATALIAAAALSTGGVTLASAASHAPQHTACSQQQAQLDRAQAKLDALTTKFAAQAAKVRKDRKAVAATTGSAKAQARKALAADKATKAHTAKAKKAQVQRVAHATAALTTCQAASTPTPSATPGA
jgi:peptidoglycan hydrolase CwlO-like protein